MRIEIQLRIVGDDNSVISADEVLHFDKSDDRVEAIGLSFGNAKAVLAAIQERVVTAQAASFLARHRCCNRCGRALLSKGPGRIQFRTAFGIIPLNSPRFYRCRCQPSASKTFGPLSELFTERTAPELLYLETKWASLVSFGLTAQLLKEVLPVGSTANAGTLRRHLHKVAARHEADLGSEQPVGLESDPDNDQPVPQETVIVGIDGGYVRNWHDKKRNFEVMVGKSMASGCNDRYFGLVASQDEQSARRLDAVLQGLPETRAVTMLTDGVLMRLNKQDFRDLMHEPLLRWVDEAQALKIIQHRGQWLDVRLPSEFQNLAIEGSINIPLYFVRLKLNALDRKMPYVVVCDTGRRSSAAAFILSERGFDAYVLKGGITTSNLPMRRPGA